MSANLTLQRALVGAVTLAVLAGLVPSAITLDRRLAGALETRARSDLALAPRIFADREAMSADAMMMRAKDVARSGGLAAALASGDRAAALRAVERSRNAGDGVPVVIGSDESAWTGLPASPELAALARRTRGGGFPVVTLVDAGQVEQVSLAPVSLGGRWVGAAGFSLDFDAQQAGVLAGLTRADVVVAVAGADAGPPRLAATTLDSAAARAVIGAYRSWEPRVDSSLAPGAPADSGGATIHNVAAGNRRLIAAVATIPGAGVAIFVRDLDAELTVLPLLRRVALLSSLVALLVALLVGGFLATRLARPVHQLASAADALAHGHFDAPLPRSAVREVARLAAAFATMRTTLAARIAQLGESNALLADRNRQLTTLQDDLVQRERLAATGRLVAQLAHEIRNPIASLRNCLELIRRRVTADPEAREFTELAIDELLRMHELAEQMLDMNRPRSSEAACCRPAGVASEVTALKMAGAPAGTAPVRCVVESPAAEAAETAIAPGALKQVLHNLVQNARESVDAGSASGLREVIVRVGLEPGLVIVTVTDGGSGIPAAVLPRVFDPFFTTKSDMHGVGLGLFVAEGIVRAAGGRLTAGNRPDAPGAVFRLALPLAGGSTGVAGAAGIEHRAPNAPVST